MLALATVSLALACLLLLSKLSLYSVCHNKWFPCVSVAVDPPVSLIFQTAPVNREVLRVLAEDGDSSITNSRVTYSIVITFTFI